MSHTNTLKQELVVFAAENIVDSNIDDDDVTATRMATELLSLKAGDEWKDLNRLKESILDVSSIPSWLDIGRSNIKDSINS